MSEKIKFAHDRRCEKVLQTDANYSLTDKSEKLLKLETYSTWTSPSAFREGCNAIPVQTAQQNHRADVQPRETATGHELLSSKNTEQNQHCRSSGCQALFVYGAYMTFTISVSAQRPSWYCWEDLEGLHWPVPSVLVMDCMHEPTATCKLQLSYPPF